MTWKILTTCRLMLVGWLAMGALNIASASTFDFSYKFSSSGQTVSGSFDGNAAGDFITDVDNISVSIDGTALTGRLYAYRYNIGWVAGNPVVSFDRNKNEVIFVNCDQFICAGGIPADYNYFLMRHSNNNENAALYKANAFNVADGYPNDSWSVTARAQVPEPGSVVLVGLAVAALVVQQRRRLPN